MRKVLHIVNGESYAGAERVQDLLALALPAFGYRVGFACLKNGVFADRRMSTDADAPLVHAPMSSQIDLGPVRKLAGKVRGEGYELVHSHTPRSALVGRLVSWLARVPMVHHVHSPTSADTENAARNRINALAESASLIGVDQVIAVSESLATRLRRDGWSDARLTVVPNGVLTRPAISTRAPPTGAWTFGVVAYFRPRKGLETLIEALTQLRVAGAFFRVIAVGAFENAEYERRVKNMISARGLASAFEWTGFTNDVDAQLRRMDALVVPSLYGEGMPMVVLEGMAAGVPVVATAVEGIPEVIVHGESGLLAQPQDPHALAGAMLSLIRGAFSWQGIRDAAHKRQRDRYSELAMARGVAQAYTRLLDQRRRPVT